MSGISRGALPDVREWSEDPQSYPGVVGRPSGMSGSGREDSRMSGSGRESLPDVREWSGGHTGCQGVVGSPFLMSGSGRESLPDVRVRSGIPS